MLNLQSDLKAKQEVLAKINADAIFKEFEEEAKPTLKNKYDQSMAYVDDIQNEAKSKSDIFEDYHTKMLAWYKNQAVKFQKETNEMLIALRSIKQQVENEMKAQVNPFVNESEQEIKTVKTKPSKDNSVKKARIIDPEKQMDLEESET